MLKVSYSRLPTIFSLLLQFWKISLRFQTTKRGKLWYIHSYCRVLRKKNKAALGRLEMIAGKEQDGDLVITALLKLRVARWVRDTC